MNNLKILLVFLIAILAGCESGNWIDEVQLHDGRIIHVTRTVSTTKIIDFDQGRPVTPTPNIHGLTAINPNTMEKISWLSKDEWVSPVLLEFDGAIAYLIISLPNEKKINVKYGCPWPPYVFLRKENKVEWKIIPATEAPSFIRFANLSRDYDQYYMRPKGDGCTSSDSRVVTRTIKDIKESYENPDYQDALIPRNIYEWNFGKNRGKIPYCSESW
jgi:hypothetical protein